MRACLKTSVLTTVIRKQENVVGPFIQALMHYHPRYQIQAKMVLYKCVYTPIRKHHTSIPYRFRILPTVVYAITCL